MYLGVLHTLKFSALRFIDLWCARFIFFRGLQVGYIFAFKCSPAFAFLGVHLSNVFKFERINITLLTVGPYKLQGLRFTFLGVEAHMFFGFGTYMSQGEGSQAFENHSCFWTCRKYVDLWVQSLRFIVFWPLSFIDAQGCEAQMILGFGAYILWTVKAPKSFQILES